MKLRVLSICIWAKELFKQQIRKSKGKKHTGVATQTIKIKHKQNKTLNPTN